VAALIDIEDLPSAAAAQLIKSLASKCRDKYGWSGHSLHNNMSASAAFHQLNVAFVSPCMFCPASMQQAPFPAILEFCCPTVQGSCRSDSAAYAAKRCPSGHGSCRDAHVAWTAYEALLQVRSAALLRHLTMPEFRASINHALFTPSELPRVGPSSKARRAPPVSCAGTHVMPSAAGVGADEAGPDVARGARHPEPSAPAASPDSGIFWQLGVDLLQKLVVGDAAGGPLLVTERLLDRLAELDIVKVRSIFFLLFLLLLAKACVSGTYAAEAVRALEGWAAGQQPHELRDSSDVVAPSTFLPSKYCGLLDK
jgi:hypothetical protein